MAAPRPPEQVMRLARMGASHPTRLSFMRGLIRRMARENWRFERLRFDMDADGYGVCVHAAHAPERTYSLIAFTQELAPERRTDRVIAEAWDATFSLFDGVPGDDDIARLAENTPKQEAGRFGPGELALARANKSLRTHAHVVRSLAAGRQPDLDLLTGTGYLMRTTAVYGNGKFGCADREKTAGRPETRGAFQIELLLVYLVRWMTIDVVEHVARECARRRGGAAATLDPAIKRHIGIGNSTGLGMAPFLAKHPILIHNWVRARETALARVRRLPSATAEQVRALRRVTARLRRHLEEWNVEDAEQQARIAVLRTEAADFESRLADMGSAHPWDRLYRAAEERYSLEGQELAVSLLLEPNGDLVDDLADGMCADRASEFDPSMTVAELQALTVAHFGWALEIDHDRADAQKRFWYHSEDKFEPRLGDRETEPGADREMPLAIARDVRALHDQLRGQSAQTPVAELAATHPEHRHAIRRVQTVARHAYGEIRDNLIDARIRPLDLLRFKLAFFGASKFDPKSDLWTRITMFQGAPMPDEIDPATADDWAFPVRPDIPQ